MNHHSMKLLAYNSEVYKLFSQEFLASLVTPTTAVAIIGYPPTELLLAATEAQCICPSTHHARKAAQSLWA